MVACATFWLAGEVRELKGLLVERQSYLGKNHAHHRDAAQERARNRLDGHDQRCRHNSGKVLRFW